ncbi:MAG TPA: hypothetical protein VEY51_02975 [Chondromyces sp.]|nr:hypothetical protein [Chondromyces sp.]
MADKIQLLNPGPSKKGAVIDQHKYEIVKETILDIIKERGTITFKELMEEVTHQLHNNFEGSPSWYCTAVKLDLEAKKVIKRIEGLKPQALTLSEKN